MDQEFWHSRWAENRIGFHQNEENNFLVKYWSKLNAKREESVLVPLCGKSLDLTWLAERQQRVVGVELSKIAVDAFFAENLLTPTVTRLSDSSTEYQFDELTVYCGDFFAIKVETVDYIYDRAALVAMPKERRGEYAAHLLSQLKANGKILLVSLEYPQEKLAGPPFSVDKAEISRLFPNAKVTELEREVAGDDHRRIQQGLEYFHEVVWLIEL
ncbi:thiopurine S-methyltransferase [Vibrio sp. SS-MA-C1-2]|uniref:thiopurine S-methyltransferase n=1 Tax=Vibrio sp. SS-MA-C1-2 TaxID=2908646 RepID=UPI001F45D396|nr:thiopurine S-methyltransferase [Vibrio sp. SS-MA-C1-2]UJF17678.1 thiopurine S-methyltransferase [Vibrio sp. SS-MA-C1-2]